MVPVKYQSVKTTSWFQMFNNKFDYILIRVFRISFCETYKNTITWYFAVRCKNCWSTFSLFLAKNQLFKNIQWFSISHVTFKIVPFICTVRKKLKHLVCDENDLSSGDAAVMLLMWGESFLEKRSASMNKDNPVVRHSQFI